MLLRRSRLCLPFALLSELLTLDHGLQLQRNMLDLFAKPVVLHGVVNALALKYHSQVLLRAVESDLGLWLLGLSLGQSKGVRSQAMRESVLLSLDFLDKLIGVLMELVPLELFREIAHVCVEVVSVLSQHLQVNVLGVSERLDPCI